MSIAFSDSLAPDRTEAQGYGNQLVGPTAAAVLRRVPAQDRSRDKVVRILDATDALLGEVGYEETVATPALIVERAKVTAGTFYTYFENVEAVIELLSLRYVDRARAIIDGLAAATYPSWEAASDAIIDAYAGFFRERPVRELWLQSRLSPTALAADVDANSYIAAQTRNVLIAGGAQHIAAGTDIQFLMLVELADHLLRLAFRLDAAGDPDAIAEVKTAHRAYLATFATSPKRRRSRKS